MPRLDVGWPWRGRSPGVVHFITWRLAAGQRPLTGAERGVVCQALRCRDGDRYRLIAYVAMDDHVHVLVQPTAVPVVRLVDSWKSFTAHQLLGLHGRRGPIWEEASSDRIVAGDEELRGKAEYIVGNPWKRWPFLKGYPWVWEAASPENAGG